MKESYKGALIFSIILFIGFKIGSHIMQAVFFGLISLIGMIVLVESIKPLKWLLSRSSRLFDVLLFVFTILSVMNYGLTTAASLTVAGLGYTLVYAPYLRSELETHKKARKKPGNYKSKFNFK